MSRFWTRNFASRNDSRAGMAPEKRDATALAADVGGVAGGGGAAAGGAASPPPTGAAVGAAESAGAVGTAGVACPSAAGLARSIRFNSDMCGVLPSAACEESALGGLIGLG